MVTALTTDAQGLSPPQFLALQVEDLVSFGTLIALGLNFRADPATHKRLMMLAVIAPAAAGFGRATESLFDPKTPLTWFRDDAYGNLLLIAGMFGWDLWRHGRIHRALLIGGMALVGVELVPAFAYFNATWTSMADGILHAWG